MIGIIVAMNADRVIGVNGSIPWSKEPWAAADRKRFKAVTMGSTVIMGRKTWESIPAKFRPLEGRRNVVLSSSIVMANGVETVGSIRAALHAGRGGDTWLIGGARIYNEAMAHADVIDVTWVPWEMSQEMRDLGFDKAGRRGANYSDCGGYHVAFFPKIDESVFAPGSRVPHPDDPRLQLQRFERRYTLRDNEALRQKGLISR